ncbi:metal-dependent hydrolase [Natronoarchaeum philippinense]|uniref:metal-dependent hydrolase n=1 Tax=Natronoarchaeum philippinense TaxID=558529 RepID=UPI000BE248FD
MYKLGHYGVSLGLYAPCSAWLLRRELPALAVLGGAALLRLTMLPDADTRLPMVSHRGPTHTVLFALAVGVAVGLVSELAIAPTLGGLDAAAFAAVPGFQTGLGGFGFFIGTLAIVSHLLADVITPMGIRPFWPISGRSFTLDITPAKNTLANYALLALGTLLSASAILTAL